MSEQQSRQKSEQQLAELQAYSETFANNKSLATVTTRAVVGVEAVPVSVEVHLANGLPSFTTVGLAETAVKESRERVRGAIVNSGFEFPAKRITINLAPADLPKNGTHYDLAIAIGILAASGQLDTTRLNDFDFVGELALDGSLRAVHGLLPMAMSALAAGQCILIPSANELEGGLLESASIVHSKHLIKVCSGLAANSELEQCEFKTISGEPVEFDLNEVKGQHLGKRALEIAASGGHSLIYMGPPGTGKSMLASRLPGILPEMSREEALEVAAIYSVAPQASRTKDWLARPYRQPHHSASAVSIVGGGTHPKPGEISLAHNGVLFLDELPEFSRSSLEQMREPLETDRIHIARANQSAVYPANFQLVAACNPCPCGFLGDETDRCQCSPMRVQSYRAKMSGPLMDRIDLHIQLPRMNPAQLRETTHEESSAQVRKRVVSTRAIQHRRQGIVNAKLRGKSLDTICALDDADYRFLDGVAEQLHFSNRAYHRILRIARTIADMEDSDQIHRHHLAEAIGFRVLDRSTH